MHSSAGTWIPEAMESFSPVLTTEPHVPLAPVLPLAPVDVHQLLHDVLGHLRRQIDAKRLDVNLQLVARGYLIRGNRDRMHDTYRNLITSAIGYAPRGGQLTVKSSCPTPEALRVEVTHCTGREARAAAAVIEEAENPRPRRPSRPARVPARARARAR